MSTAQLVNKLRVDGNSKWDIISILDISEEEYANVCSND